MDDPVASARAGLRGAHRLLPGHDPCRPRKYPPQTHRSPIDVLKRTLKPCCSYSGGKVPEAATANAIVRLLQAAGACTTINPYERILPLYSPRPCFVLPAQPTSRHF